MNMPIMEMLCMHAVYVGPKSVKDTCLSRLSIVWYTADNTLTSICLCLWHGSPTSSLPLPLALDFSLYVDHWWAGECALGETIPKLSGVGLQVEGGVKLVLLQLQLMCLQKNSYNKCNKIRKIMKIIRYSELQKHCNVWQFWIACDVALYSIGITLSIVEMK